MWKTQSPPVSMETPSLSQAERQSPSTFRIRGVNYSTLFNAGSITHIQSTTDTNILINMRIDSVVNGVPIYPGGTTAKVRHAVQTSAAEDAVW